MICQVCGSANAEAARFCDNCGSPFSSACPVCGSQNRVGARFCGTCGTALQAGAATATPAGDGRPPAYRPGTGTDRGAERRVVTILFADLVGFTPYAEDRDPEAVREMLSAYFDTTRAIIERHGGVVEKFIGDAVMAVWGTPVAHEDDAERAVRAGLEIASAVGGLGPGIQARVGLLTGEAAVTLGATNEGMVAGDLVNTAARLQSAAPPGTVLVGEATMRSAEAAISFEPAGEQSLKGKTSPVPAWHARRVIAERGGYRRAEQIEAPFVGRDDELRMLKDLLHATTRDHRARLVSITGPAGIGKSRLAWELEKYIDGVVETIYWHHGRSPSYGDGVTFWALGEMVRQRAGLAEADDEETTRARVSRLVVETVPDDADRRWVEPALLTLLGLEPPPTGGRDVLFAAWRILFERIAERGTAVLLFEDLHWADSGLLDFIDHLLGWAKASPILVISLARPELFERRPDWGTGVRNVTGIALEPLGEPAMRELLGGLVPGLPEPVVAGVIGRADGIPLYAVEMVRSLLADGRLERSDGTVRVIGDVTAITVPESLRSLVASRLDALEPGDRTLLQDAAVLGQTFVAGILAAVDGREEVDVETRLRDMVRREFIELETDPRSPERGQYRFVQSLIREVAYATLSRRDRRARHLAVARVYEALGDPELAGILASHYLAAQAASDAGPEADALAAQARIALRAAADRAASLGAYAQAVVFLDQAIAVTTDPATHADLLLEKARASNFTGTQDAAAAAARAAIDAYTAIPDDDGVARSTATLGLILVDAGLPIEAIDELERALARMTDPEQATLRAGIEARLARAYMRTGRPDDAIAAADRALVVAERYSLEGVVGEAFVNKGSSLSNLGRNREAEILIRAAVAIAEEVGDVELEVRARNNLASALGANDQEGAQAIARSGYELGRRLGSRANADWLAGMIAINEYALGRDWDAGLAILDEVLADATGADEARLRSIRYFFMGDRGEPIEELIAEWRSIVSAYSDPEIVPTDHELQGVSARARGDLESAYAAFETAGRVGVQNAYFSYSEAAFTAARLRDPDRLAAAAGAMDEAPRSGRVDEAYRAWAHAALAALRGDSGDASSGFRRSFDFFRDIDFDGARARILAAWLLPDDPDAAAWLDFAEEVIARCRAVIYEPWLADARAALPRHTAAAPERLADPLGIRSEV